jgi:uncharacterized protein (TIGR03435 family)
MADNTWKARRRALFVAVMIVALAGSSTADVAQQETAFDAASVKESSTLELDGVFNTTPGRFTVTNLSLRWIIRYAFRLRDYQVIGAPGWADTRYNINATVANPAATDDEVRPMLQRLLAERFQLRAHREQRNLQMYALIRERPDGPLGPKLTSSDVDCSRPPAERAAPPPPAGGRARPSCTMFQTAWFIRGFARTMPQLVRLLDEVAGSPVVDRTGLTGAFDFDVTWGKPGDLQADPNVQTTEDLAALFTALREQLGLRLDATRGPYDVLVIDAVSRPTPD